LPLTFKIKVDEKRVGASPALSKPEETAVLDRAIRDVSGVRSPTTPTRSLADARGPV